MFNVLKSAKPTCPSTCRKLTSHVHNVAGKWLVDCDLLETFFQGTVGTPLVP